MISYEDLCQALDRFNNRAKAQEELAQLEGTQETADAADYQANDGSDAVVTENPFAAAPLNTGEMDAEVQVPAVDPDGQAAPPMDDTPAQDPEGEAMAGQEHYVGDQDQVPAADFASAPPEDTHEIDVDEMVVDENK